MPFSIDSLYIAAIIQGAFQVIVLLTNRATNRQQSIFLAMLVFCLTWSLWNLLTYTGAMPAAYRLFDFSLWVSHYLWGRCFIFTFYP